VASVRRHPLDLFDSPFILTAAFLDLDPNVCFRG
jgi:hypothetical protein